ADPLTARFDHILRAIGNLHHTIRMHDSDITCVEPQSVSHSIFISTVITLNDPWATNLQRPTAHAVTGSNISVLAHHTHFNTKGRSSLFVKGVHSLVNIKIIPVGGPCTCCRARRR